MEDDHYELAQCYLYVSNFLKVDSCINSDVTFRCMWPVRGQNNTGRQRFHFLVEMTRTFMFHKCRGCIDQLSKNMFEGNCAVLFNCPPELYLGVTYFEDRQSARPSKLKVDCLTAGAALVYLYTFSRWNGGFVELCGILWLFCKSLRQAEDIFLFSILSDPLLLKCLG
jgi:hypothetical protein